MCSHDRHDDYVAPDPAEEAAAAGQPVRKDDNPEVFEERLRDDVEATHAVIHALNEWMHETWSFNYEGRIFATPIINFSIVDQALAEVDYVLERL